MSACPDAHHICDAGSQWTGTGDVGLLDVGVETEEATVPSY